MSDTLDFTCADPTIIAESSKTFLDKLDLLDKKLFAILFLLIRCLVKKHGSKKLRSKLNLKLEMKENKLENLEKEVSELIKLSQQLKEINEHLLKKNIQQSKDIHILVRKLDIAKEGITRIVKKYKV